MQRGAATRLIALLGDPVEHSRSPMFQNAAITAAGLDAVYVAIRCDAESMPGLLRGIARSGGAGNVTIPHKQAAATLVDEPSDAVRQTGACNTFWAEASRIHGDNTDVAGFLAAARALIGSPAGARVLVIGAGGAARAAVLGLIEERADAIHVVNRSADRAEALRAGLDPRGRRVAILPSDRLHREGYDLVVNATSLGLGDDDPLPLDLDRPARIGAALDLVYSADGTAWVAEARRRGIPAADGTAMLLRQGAASFERWFGVTPDTDVMQRALAEGTWYPGLRFPAD